MFRQVAREKQALPKEACIDILKQQPRGVLALLGDGGYPYALPINHWYNETDGRLYFHSGSTGHKIDALKANPKASFCVLNDGEKKGDDWFLTFQSVIAFGTIGIVEDHDQAIGLTRQLSYKYTPDETYIEAEISAYHEDLLVFYLEIQHLTGKVVKES